MSFDEGEGNWPEEAPFRTPVFVLTHQLRAPWERKGGTTSYFVNEDVQGSDPAKEQQVIADDFQENEKWNNHHTTVCVCCAQAHIQGHLMPA